ncbi:MAG: CopD family protein [Betaproteobacteria bacterium]|nr:CopD family protein [Betaproteobacteria bacterium]
MTYKLLLFFHLAAIIVWIGGMVFAHFCLRPAAIQLAPPQRVPLMHAALSRFFVIVAVAIAIVLASGFAMMLMAGMKSAPMAWHIMAGLGVLMMAIFGHIRFVPFKRLGRAVTAADWPGAAKQLDQIRLLVTINMGIGFGIVAVMTVGR